MLEFFAMANFANFLSLGLLAKEGKPKCFQGSVSLCKVNAFVALTNIWEIYSKGDGKSIKLSLAYRLLSLFQVEL